MMATYGFRPEAPFLAAGLNNFREADAQVIGEELEKISALNDGKLHPGDVIEAAREESSRLHRFFEWNNALAAEKFRENQARLMIRNVYIVNEASPQKELIRSWLNINAGIGGHSYRSTSEVINNRHLQLAVLQQAERDLLAWETRYRDLEQICNLIRKARDELRKRIRDHDGDDDDRRPSA